MLLSLANHDWLNGPLAPGDAARAHTVSANLSVIHVKMQFGFQCLFPLMPAKSSSN